MAISLSYLVLTPRRVRLPGDRLLHPSTERASEPLFSQWTTRLTFKAKSFRPSASSRVELPVDEMGATMEEGRMTD